MGLHMAGFEVTGVDINTQPHYPFDFILGDAMSVKLEGYDLIWASPPCQAFTLAQRIRKREHPDLIAPVRKMLKETGTHYVIENVEGAPLKNPVTLCGAMFPGLRVYRHRLFEASFYIPEPQHPEHAAKLRKMGRRVQEGEFMHVVGNFSGVELAREAMGISWMKRDELREAIPPAYSEYVGRHAMKAIAMKLKERVAFLEDERQHRDYADSMVTA